MSQNYHYLFIAIFQYCVQKNVLCDVGLKLSFVS